jgi:hypothetical protein
MAAAKFRQIRGRIADYDRRDCVHEPDVQTGRAVMGDGRRNQQLARVASSRRRPPSTTTHIKTD